MRYPYRTWYVTFIAAYYLILCSVNTLFLVSWYFRPGFLVSAREFLPLVAALFSLLYFLMPKWGHRGLITLTVLVLLLIGDSDPGALMFHLTVLFFLVLPFFTRRTKVLWKPALAA
jgi:hypothetical protein